MALDELDQLATRVYEGYVVRKELARQLNELSDEMMMKLSILYYADAREALLKALGD